jgi:hypothetical protein
MTLTRRITLGIFAAAILMGVAGCTVLLVGGQDAAHRVVQDRPALWVLVLVGAVVAALKIGR